MLLRKKFKKYIELIFKDLCIKHNAKGVSAYALLKVSRYAIKIMVIIRSYIE